MKDGTYACEIYSGWKLLEWKDGEWWHLGVWSRWGASEPLQWVGPLPDKIGESKHVKEWDL